MREARKPFGLRGTETARLGAGAGLDDGAPSRPRKMSLTVGLIAAGAVAVAGGGIYEQRRRADAAAAACRAEAAAKPGGRPEDCEPRRSSSATHSGRSSWIWHGSGSSGSAARSASSSKGHGVFGGFGRSGSMHFSGS